MASRDLRIVGGTYFLRDLKTAVQRSINCYPMRVEGYGEDSPAVLESAPGLELFADIGAEIRGAHNASGRLFAVAGAALYEVTAAGAFTSVGLLSSSSGRVGMANGTRQIAVVDGNLLYVYSLDAGTFSVVTAEGWRGSNQVQYIDGYFIFVDPGTEQFYITAVDDATVIDGLDFSSADTQPDNIIAHVVRKREAYFFGSMSCEVWINSGDPDFPFARYQGTPIDVGIVGPWAVTRAADTLVWVGQTDRGGPYVYRMDGYQPVRISDQCVEQQLEAADYANATCWAYQEAGGEFVCINAPGMATTLVWDASTGIWHERAELVNGAWQQLRVDHHAFFNGGHIVGGGSKLYRMSRDYESLAGDVLARERTFPHLLQPSLEPISYPALEIRCTTGSATQGSITLEVSNDGGSVFGPPLRRSLGAEGRRQQRVRWMGLGTCPAGGSRVFRLRCTDAVPLTIQGATL